MQHNQQLIIQHNFIEDLLINQADVVLVSLLSFALGSVTRVDLRLVGAKVLIP